MCFTLTYLTRRRIMSLSSKGATFTIVSPQLVRGTQFNSRIKIGLTGSGNRGTFVAGIAKGDPRAEVTVLCDAYDDPMEKASSKLQLQNPARWLEWDTSSWLVPSLNSANQSGVAHSLPPQSKFSIYC